ncbi:MAG: hypothetical protein AAB369_02420, partial [Chloroflexota bacterium]
HVFRNESNSTTPFRPGGAPQQLSLRKSLSKEATMKRFIIKALASLMEGVVAPRGVLVPFAVPVHAKSTRIVRRVQ